MHLSRVQSWMKTCILLRSACYLYSIVIIFIFRFDFRDDILMTMLHLNLGSAVNSILRNSLLIFGRKLVMYGAGNEPLVHGEWGGLPGTKWRQTGLKYRKLGPGHGRRRKKCELCLHLSPNTANNYKPYKIFKNS